jgi:hypothetical protein
MFRDIEMRASAVFANALPDLGFFSEFCFQKRTQMIKRHLLGPAACQTIMAYGPAFRSFTPWWPQKPLSLFFL